MMYGKTITLVLKQFIVKILYQSSVRGFEIHSFYNRQTITFIIMIMVPIFDCIFTELNSSDTQELPTSSVLHVLIYSLVN